MGVHKPKSSASTNFSFPKFIDFRRFSSRCCLDTFACQFECPDISVGIYREHRRTLDMTAVRPLLPVNYCISVFFTTIEP